MAKGKGMRLPMSGATGGKVAQLQKLQQELAATQEALGSEVVQVSAGGGAVQVTITGHLRVQSLTIDREVVDPDDVEMLQDLIVAAVNEAIEKAQQLASQRMGQLTAGLLQGGLPGLF